MYTRAGRPARVPRGGDCTPGGGPAKPASAWACCQPTERSEGRGATLCHSLSCCLPLLPGLPTHLYLRLYFLVTCM